MSTKTQLGGDWNLDDPSTWSLTTTVDAHLGYHASGAVVREYRTIVHRADDHGDPLDGQPAAPDTLLAAARWWAAVLTPIHDAAVAAAEASPEELAAAAAALGVDGDALDDWLVEYDDLEQAADRAGRLAAALAGS